MSDFPMPSAAEFQAMTPDEFESFWNTFVALGIDKTPPFAGRLYNIGKHDIRDACTLKRAGWSPEPQTKLSQLMSWNWRRPAIGSRQKGKRFMSTSQAINELRRMEMKNPSTPISTFTVEYLIDRKPVRANLSAKGILHAQLLADSIHAKVINP